MEISQILMSNIAIIIYECMILTALMINTFRLRSRNKKAVVMASLQKDRIREENLDLMLKNSMYEQRDNRTDNKNNPYDVVYHEEKSNVYEDTRERISLQIEEMGVLSIKKYVIQVFDSITIGSDESNKIILNDLAVSRKQIQFIHKEKELYVQNIDCSVEVFVYRKKKKYPLNEMILRVESDDNICVGNTRLKLTII